MALRNTLDTPILNSRAWHPWVSEYKDRHVGIELELEGDLAPIEAAINPSFWGSKPDGSLRDGMEFVLAAPIKLEHLDDACAELNKALKKMRPKTSIRTSTHVHVNILDLTIRQVYQAAAGYYLLEELLIGTQPKERRGNLFCLRMSDADSVSIFLKKSLQTGRFFQMYNEDHHKYSALNLCTVNRFGSLEFRIFEAMMPDDFKKWVIACHELIRNSAKLDVKTLLDMYDDLPVKTFLKNLMPKSSFIWEGKSDDYLNECLRTNYDKLRDLARQMVQPTFTTPREFWNEDTELPDIHTIRYRYEHGLVGPEYDNEFQEEPVTAQAIYDDLYTEVIDADDD